MKISNEAQIRLDYFSSLYENAVVAMGEAFENLDRCMRQYRGSREIDGSNEEALTVRNITYEIVESQVSSDIPYPKTDPTSYSERRERNAESIERLCRALRKRLPFGELNDIDERYTYIYGGSVWYVEWEHDTEYMGEMGTVKIHCLSPRDFIPQPGISSVEDMEYCFLRFITTKDEVMRRYDKTAEELEGCELAYESGMDIPERDALALTVCFWRDEVGDVARYIFSGEVTLSDIPKFYHRKSLCCSVCGKEQSACKCDTPLLVQGDVEREVLEKDKLLRSGYTIPAVAPEVVDGHTVTVGGREKMKRTEIPYYVPKLFPIVIRKNTSAEGELYGQSDCDYIRPQQQAINKIESRILQKLLRAGVTPIMPEDASISANNSVFGQVIRMKPGESPSQYGKVDTTPDISQDIAEAERLYDQAKRVVGISDAYQGIDTGFQESGIAKQLRISQARGRLDSKVKMKNYLYAALDRIIFGLYLAFADEPRQLSYKDAFGRIHYAQFNRYDFIEFDVKSGEYYYDDAYIFSADPSASDANSREAMWQRNLENLKAGTLGDPQSPSTLLRYWQCQERAHYPQARENVEYFTEAVNKEGGMLYG
ncbi:MAG: hypothetical protein IJY24_02815 [Clostridia bacterium]|nr:hypothetical protein [Clostridia bacterium]